MFNFSTVRPRARVRAIRCVLPAMALAMTTTTFAQSMPIDIYAAGNALCALSEVDGTTIDALLMPLDVR